MEDRKIEEIQDLRIVKTENAIKKAFISLLKRKPYSKISVTEIVEKAQINRNTFYLHYIDKEDLLNHLVVDEFGKYDKIITKGIENYYIISHNFTEDKLYNLIKEMIVDITKDIDFYRLIIKDEDMKGYILKIKDYARNKFGCLIDSSIKTKQACLEFCFEGTFGLMLRYIDEGENLASIDEITTALTKLIFEIFRNIKIKKE